MAANKYSMLVEAAEKFPEGNSLDHHVSQPAKPLTRRPAPVERNTSVAKQPPKELSTPLKGAPSAQGLQICSYQTCCHCG